MTNDYNAFRVTMNAGAPGQVSTARGKGAVASASRQASELAIQVLQDGFALFGRIVRPAMVVVAARDSTGTLTHAAEAAIQSAGD